MSGPQANDREPQRDDSVAERATRGEQRDLQPGLTRATETLRSALTEACSVNVDRIDTGELIRVEEVLAIAGEAAKEAISVRRSARAPQRASSAASEGSSSRSLTDRAGRQWTVFAVHPSAPRGHSVLREGYADGWLSFDAGDETRRVAPIPPGWEQLSDSALLDLCGAAEPSRPRRRQT
jgi:hypothetical protein